MTILPKTLEPLDAPPELAEKAGLKFRTSFLPEKTTSQQNFAFLVHGRAGNESVKWPFARAFDSQKTLIVTPCAPFKDDIGGYSWWEVSKRGGHATVEELLHAVETLEGFIEKLLGIYAAKNQKLASPEIVLSGFSQGSAVSALVALRAKVKVKAVLMLAGFIPRCVINSPNAFELEDELDLEFLFVHGTKDMVIPLDKAQAGEQFIRDLGYQTEFVTDEVGHKVGSEGMKALKRFVKKVAV